MSYFENDLGYEMGYEEMGNLGASGRAGAQLEPESSSAIYWTGGVNGAFGGGFKPPPLKPPAPMIGPDGLPTLDPSLGITPGATPAGNGYQPAGEGLGALEQTKTPSEGEVPPESENPGVPLSKIGGYKPPPAAPGSGDVILSRGENKRLEKLVDLPATATMNEVNNFLGDRRVLEALGGRGEATGVLFFYLKGTENSHLSEPERIIALSKKSDEDLLKILEEAKKEDPEELKKAAHNWDRATQKASRQELKALEQQNIADARAEKGANGYVTSAKIGANAQILTTMMNIQAQYINTMMQAIGQMNTAFFQAMSQPRGGK